MLAVAPTPTPYPTVGDGVANAWTCNDRSSPSPSVTPVAPLASPSPTAVPVKVGQDCAVTGWTPTSGQIAVWSGPSPLAVNVRNTPQVSASFAAASGAGATTSCPSQAPNAPYVDPACETAAQLHRATSFGIPALSVLALLLTALVVAAAFGGMSRGRRVA